MSTHQIPSSPLYGDWFHDLGWPLREREREREKEREGEGGRERESI